jgi:NTP pyrophosphatase (non-canonical NTP hydrolase)
MTQIDDLTKLVNEFRDARNWRQFHTLKDMALSLMLEAGEVAEHFQWRQEKDVSDYLKAHRDELGEELADVMYWVLAIANDSDIDLDSAFRAKMMRNGEKYPVEKAKDRADKWDKL